ncbi:gliding motility-associated ABC transporter ATP-binding subunit GldA [Parasegetibacter sp. NRK P23]|uniref:gliding motility-associated ABC transporter ATP-binding subunit GldA n=1 Tax=Parasegetibacter sp. NRK P23 TaxID=2942999 RepID=UPI0020432AD1|nr:gliding motility-associated ABC transporter ATP-binding subunit GldA [Parasegetibacter sp. NRK P23]MCM5527442.1 gliding motility-associated ABC transporter ATP-binding subunit GldA [Parasegetibacter sp. NRK P23]
MSISIEAVSKHYGTQKAVNNISFSLKPGEIVGFLGPNGAGKSTTMKMMTGYLQPDGGKITVNGISVQAQPLEVKKKIGYLPEANPLYYDMYVKEYLHFIAGVHGLGKKTKERVNAVIAMTGLTPESHKKTGQLSKGYKQRVGLAAALIHDPEVLILDEPTSGLDPNQIIEIREVIRSLGQQKTILFSTHILQEVEALCERVIIINKGELVADAPLSDLKNTNGDQQRLRVNFGEPLEAEWLLRLPDTLSAEKTDAHTWLLTTSSPEKLRKQILELALQHNLNIVSLQSENGKLEDIFRELTAQNKPQ